MLLNWISTIIGIESLKIAMSRFIQPVRAALYLKSSLNNIARPFYPIHIIPPRFQKRKLFADFIFVIKICFTDQNTLFFIKHVHDSAPWICEYGMSP